MKARSCYTTLVCSENMKTVGVIGGIAPESTIEYYRKIISGYQSQTSTDDYPQIIINSINMTKMLGLIADGSLIEVSEYLALEIEKLNGAGADFVVMASNTPHVVFDEVQRLSSLPLISIVEASCKAIVNTGLQRVALFGTKFTMQGGFYNELLSANGVVVITPGDKDQDYIHSKYMSEFVKGVFLNETRLELMNIINGMRQQEGVQGLILGGTELPFILKETDLPDFPMFDTTEIHVKSVLNLLK